MPIIPFDDAPAVDRARRRTEARPLVRSSGDAGVVRARAERDGLPADVVASNATRVATIPLEPGAESLNVAAAGAIALYSATSAARVTQIVSSPPAYGRRSNQP